MTQRKQLPYEMAAQLRHSADGLRPRLIPALDVMDGHHIFLHEFAILMLWLCAPPLIIAVVTQLWWFRRMKVLQKGQAVRAALALAGTILLTPIVSVALWKITPYAFLPRRVLPEGAMPIPPMFLPAILSCAVLASLFSWWVVRGDRHDV